MIDHAPRAAAGGTSPRIARALGASLAAALLVLPAAGAYAGEDLVVEKGRTVSIEYTLTLDDGTVADSNVNGEPLRYEQGAGRLLPAVEQALAGMKAEERRQFTIAPADGYGEYNPEAVREIDIERIPEGARSVGALLTARAPNGATRRVRVKEVREKTVLLDFNHPLAGQALHFDVRVLSVE